MNLKELFWSGGGMVLVLLSLIEVSPIKINPWSRLAKIIGHALNAEVLEQQKQTQKKLEEHIYPCFHIAYTSLSCGAITATPIQISQCLPSELRFHSPPSVSNAAIMP